MPTALLHSQLKHLCFLSLLIKLSVYQTQASSLGILITFVKTFSFNLAVRFVCFAFVSRAIKLDLFEATCVEIPLNIILGWKWVTVRLLCYAKKFYSTDPSKEIGNFGWNLLLRRLKILPLNFKHFQLWRLDEKTGNFRISRRLC